MGGEQAPHSSDKDLRSWWNIFGDPQLNHLVSTSLNNNPDMKVALLRIREAREKLRVSQASLLPSADASAGWSLSPDRGFRSSTSQNFSLGASTSWELDLFGGNRRSIEASRASLMSTEASAGAVRTALLADVATAYFDWITACEQLRIAREQLEIQRSTLTIAEKRYKTEFAPVWMWSRPPPPSPPRKAASRNWKHRWPPLKTSSPCCWEHTIPV